MLASCKRVYFLSDLTIRAAHSIVRASTSHTGRLIAGSLGTLGALLRALNTAHLLLFLDF
jgi:hypothetical protein